MTAKRILIVEVNWLGDVLFSTPFIRAVRNNFPGAYIACIVVPRVKEVLQGNPYINDIITYDEKNSRKSPSAMTSSDFQWLEFRFLKFHTIKKYNFDTAFLLHRSFTRTLMTYLAGIPNRIGYYTFKRALLLTERPKAPGILSLHRAEYYLRLAKAAGLKTDDKGCDFFVSQQDLDWATAQVSGSKAIIFNPGGNWLPKRWPEENFIELGKLILSKYGNTTKIIITGSVNDLELARQINKALDSKAVILCGKATIKQSAALFKRSELVISGDSGPLHMAVAVGARVIGLFGPTSPKITGPYKADEKRVAVLYKDIGCKVPCYDDKCADYRCMAAISAQEVFNAAGRLLG